MYPRSDRGFTLIEVLAALLIAAVAITYLIQSETTSVHTANVTRDLREATLLGNAKLGEIIAGAENNAAGDFEERENWRWEASREPFEEGFGTALYVVTVYYTSAGRNVSLTLQQVAP
jgi:prepilin-type N-terminal cleavage/methylation domain-containing protein